MSHEISIVAIFSPVKGKESIIIEALTGLAKIVEASETGTLIYELLQEINSEANNRELVMIEKYASREDMESHVNSEAVQKLIKKLNEDGLLTAPPLIKIATGITGFTR